MSWVSTVAGNSYQYWKRACDISSRRIKMSMVITLMVTIPIAVAYGFMNTKCGDAGLQAIQKQKDHLHVIDESWRWDLWVPGRWV